ncbi:DUF1983 domain-containing protein [Enterobacter sp.]|uniref:phage tail tip fiber protein n=1 Tax=Enterobacter sp. TaxID=42895 RepID=UPI00296E5325|nr:DUF1983 domain-containing protein [Enterobacter sp.]
MTECLSIPCVTTTPKPFGVNVEWKWPDLSFWGSQLELQYLLADDRLVKEVISWPVTGLLISGRKAGERLQVRLRPVAADGSTRDWRIGDWIDGVTSADSQEIADYVLDSLKDASPFTIKDGEVFIKDAFICNGITIAKWSTKVNTDENGRRYAAGIAVAVENGKKQVKLLAEKFEVNMSGTQFKIRLSDEIREAVNEAALEVIRNALKPGGLLYTRGR